MGKRKPEPECIHEWVDREPDEHEKYDPTVRDFKICTRCGRKGWNETLRVLGG